VKVRNVANAHAEVNAHFGTILALTEAGCVADGFQPKYNVAKREGSAAENQE
jgi:hypothetical protein